jgi:hypothetical protein
LRDAAPREAHAVEYADQNQRDDRAFVNAIRDGRIEVQVEDIL